MATDTIRSKTNRSLITIDLEEHLSDFHPKGLDISDWLWQGLAVKEDLFRNHLEKYDWNALSKYHVHVYCSVDAIIPTWAYMLIASKLTAHSIFWVLGNEQDVLHQFIDEVVFPKIEADELENKRIVIKGCSKIHLSEAVYMKLTARLQPKAQAIHFGEPCSTVPVFKKER